MSLMSLISQSGTASSSGSSLASGVTRTARAADNTAMAATSTSAVGTSDGATISAAARAAAAAKDDNAKDFTALSKEVRATLDAQYKRGKAKGVTDPAPDLSGMSGRALAAMVLNKTGAFTKAESRAAKSALDDQLRESFATAGSTYGTGIGGLASFSQQMVSQYDSMSAEEREARGWTDSFRASNAGIQTAAKSSLFDMIGN